jgi:hypothetical protein
MLTGGGAIHALGDAQQQRQHPGHALFLRARSLF